MHCCQLIAPALIIAGLAPVGPAATEGAKVEKYRLDNGLSVMLRPVAGAKETALVVLYAIGGDHDPKGRSGLAHVMEHLYCTSAAGEFQAQTYAEIVKRYPRGANFQTGDRYTVHATVYAAAELEHELKEAAARMGALKITQADLNRELPRIDLELRNMFARIPQLAVMNLAREKVRPTPLGGRKAGLMQHIKSMTVEDFNFRWHEYYKPDNAILVLAGAVDVNAARKCIAAHFAKIPPAKKMPPVQAPGKPTLGQSEEILVKAAVAGADPIFACAFRAPPPNSDLYAPFLVAVARIHALRTKLDPDPKRYPVSWTPIDDPEVIYLNVPNTQGATAKELLARVRKFLDSVADGEVTAADHRAASLTFGRLLGLLNLPDTLLAQEPYGLAFGLGRREQMGVDPEKLGKAVEAVTAKDVERVMREVFGPDKCAAVLVRPQ